MRFQKFVLVLLLPFLLLGSCGKNNSFSPWMARADFTAFVAEKDKKSAEGKNFWDLGHCVAAVETRWTNGYQQYRVKIIDTPKQRPFWWMWYYNMNQAEFEKRLTEASLDGYQMVSLNKSVNPSDIVVYAAVWHKTATNK